MLGRHCGIRRATRKRGIGLTCLAVILALGTLPASLRSIDFAMPTKAGHLPGHHAKWSTGVRESSTTHSVGQAIGERNTVTTTTGLVRTADVYCTTPGVYDQTCLNNAILSLDGNGHQFSGSGRIYVPAHVYVLTAPVVLHKGIRLDMDSPGGAVLEGDGTNAFPAGLVRFCDNEACSDTPVTHGESDINLTGVHIRLANAGDIGLNGYGLTDSMISDLLVDSTTTSVTGGIGTGVVLTGDSRTSDYRNTFVALTVREVARGVVLGNVGDANANSFLGGSVQGDPALDMVSGSGNSFWGMTFNGTNTTGDVLVRLGPGSIHNIFYGNYYDDGLGSGTCVGAPCSATAISVARGAQGNGFYGTHFDSEGGSMLGLNNRGDNTDYYSLGPIPSASPSTNDRLIAGGGGNVYFTAPTSARSHYGFGNGSTAPTLAYGFAVGGISPLDDGVELFNTASGNPENALKIDWYLNNSAGTKVLFGGWHVDSIDVNPGSEDSSIALRCRTSGAIADCLRFDGANGFLAATLAPSVAGAASLGTLSLPFASWCVGDAANRAACVHGKFTGARTIWVPDAASATATNATPLVHRFLTGFNAATGTFSRAQPSIADLSDGTASGAGTVKPDAVVLNSAMPIAATATVRAIAVPSQNCIDIPAIVPGAAIEMAVTASPRGSLSAGWPQLQWSAYVSAANTICVHICNPTRSVIKTIPQIVNIRVGQ